VQVTFKSVQQAGDLNVVIVGWSDSTTQVSSVSDTSGNVYHLAVGPTVLKGSASQSIYYASNIVAAAARTNIVTVSFTSAPSFPDVRVLEYSGIDPVAPVDAVTAQTAQYSTTTSTDPVTTNYAMDLLVAANCVETWTNGPSLYFTLRLLTSPDGDIAEDSIATVPGSYSASAPLSDAGWSVMQMVAFRAASAP
jgi:hypothetical protein